MTIEITSFLKEKMVGFGVSYDWDYKTFVIGLILLVIEIDFRTGEKK